MKTKTCNKCKENKPITEFQKDKRLKSGLKSTCKSCVSTYGKQYNKTSEAKQKRKASDALRKSVDPRIDLYNGAKQRSKKNNIIFSITIEDIVIPIICPVLGIELQKNKKMSDNSMTLDRINNEKGYVKDNIKVISWKANRLKSNATIIELQKIINYMIENDENYRVSGEKRSCRPTKYYTFNGKSQGLKDWAEELNISENILNNRLNRNNWSIERAFTTPIQHKTKIKKKES